MPDERDPILWRLHCAQGHLGAVANMLEAECTCEEVLIQLAAVRGELDTVALRLICEQVERSKHAIRYEPIPERRCEELKRLVSLYELWNKSNYVRERKQKEVNV